MGTALQPGDRIRLVHTDDPYTRLGPGSPGVLVEIRPDPAHPDEHILDIDWDSGSDLSLLTAAGDRIEPA